MLIPALDALAVPTVPAAPADPLTGAVRALASRCDGALAHDGQGFDSTDARFGARLAALPDALWTHAMRVEAHRMLAKYTGQLDRLGIDYGRIPAPAPVEAEEARESRQDARRRLDHVRASHEDVVVTQGPSGPFLTLSVPYSGSAVAALRDLPGRRWDGTVNTVPLEQARAVLALASRFGWRVSAEVREAALAAPAPAAAAPPARTLGLELGMLSLRWEPRDPHFAAMRDVVKQIPGRAWDGEARCWRCPVTPAAAAAVSAFAERFGLEVAPRAAEAIAGAAGAAIARAEASRALDADFDVDTLALPLHPFQRAGVAYAAANRRVFIADEMGLGKTPQGLATVEATDAYPALFVVPDSLKKNWEREAGKFLPHRQTLVVLGQTPRADYSADIVIIGYSTVSFHVEALKREGFKAVVLDESHAAKNPKAARTKAVLALGEMPGVEVKLCLSGTPLPNMPRELLPQLQFLGRLQDVGGRRDFWLRYCQDYVPMSALTALHEQLRQTCFVRRTKTDVLPELPAVQVSAVDADLSARERREIGATLSQAEAALVEYDAARGADRAEARSRAMGALATMRRQLGVAKVPAAVEWIRAFHEAGGGPLVVFAHHVEVQNLIAEAFPGCARIVAGMDGAALMGEVDRFQAGQTNLIVVSLMAGSVGLTLTAASHMLVVELPWVPKDLSQAHARCYGRVNDAHGLNAYHLLAPGTLDEKVAEILERKLRTTTAVQDGLVLDEVEASKSIQGEILESLLAELVTPAVQQ